MTFIKSGKHDGSKKNTEHFKKQNGGSSVSKYNWFYWLPHIIIKKTKVDIFWFNRALVH